MKNRLIKFRGWSEDCKCMISPDNTAGVSLNFKGDIRIGGLVVKDVSLMQFTGLNDESGKPIYEGDIVKALRHNEYLFTDKVWWRSGILWFGNWNWIEFQNIFRSIEVIGNIYEHPHLLGDKQ